MFLMLGQSTDVGTIYDTVDDRPDKRNDFSTDFLAFTAPAVAPEN